MALPRFLVVDTCVLMSTIIRRLLLRCATEGGISLLWSDKIQAEWMRNAPVVWKVEPELVATEWQQMQVFFPNACITEDGASRALVRKTDPKDQHVVATALSHRKQMVVEHQWHTTAPGDWAVLTWNMKDFHKKELRDLQLGLWNPDTFFMEFFQTFPDVFLQQQAQLQADLASLEKADVPIPVVFRQLRLFKTIAQLERQGLCAC